jgi:hypothetical protein
VSGIVLAALISSGAASAAYTHEGTIIGIVAAPG